MIFPRAIRLALVTLAFASANSIGSAAAIVGQPPEIASLPASPLHWTPLRAPGFDAPAISGLRPTALLRTWSRLAENPDGSLAPAETVHLPDAWSSHRDFHAAWYLAHLDLDHAPDGEAWLCFESVAHVTTLFVNGHEIGRHTGAFTPFAFDLAPALHAGINTLALRVRDESAVVFPDRKAAVSQLGVDRPPGNRSPAGIRGLVSLELRPPVHLGHVLIHTSTRRGEIQLSLTLPAGSGPVDVTNEILPWPAGDRPALRPAPIHASLSPDTPLTLDSTTAWPGAARWSPEHPNLYVLRTTVRAGGRADVVETRFGFREFWTEGRDFILNGQPIRLFGTSSAHFFRYDEALAAARAGRDYARDTFRFLKENFHYNSARLHAAIYPRSVIEGADEAGVLLIAQSAVWSAMAAFYDNGQDALLPNLKSQFAEWFWRDADSPSIVIWDVENEMLRISRAPDRVRWASALDAFIKDLDPTRLTEHAGSGWYSPDQDIIHVHMQERYTRVLDEWIRRGGHPIVFGEFWMGGRGETRLPDSAEFTSAADWQRESALIYREKFLELRAAGASGIMPFVWEADVVRPTPPEKPGQPTTFRWIHPDLQRPAADALAPVVAFAWPRRPTLLAGQPLPQQIVICNDRETSATLDVTATYAGQSAHWRITLAPAAQTREPLSFSASASAPLQVTVRDASGADLAGDVLPLHVLPATAVQPPSLTRRLLVIPAPDAATAAALHDSGLAFDTANELPPDAASSLVIVPPDAPRDAFGRNPDCLDAWLRSGGRLLVLRQDSAPPWLPVNFAFSPGLRGTSTEFQQLGWPAQTKDLIYSRVVPVYAPGHPVFAGLDPSDFRYWNLHDGRVADDAFVRPAFLDQPAGAPFRVLAGATRRELVTLAESRIGAGTALFCQLQVIAQHDSPAARALLANLLRYLDGPGWSAPATRLGLAGRLQPADVAALTGLPAEAIVPIAGDEDAPPVVVAGPGAKPALLDRLARAGHTVLVLSTDTARHLPGYECATHANITYTGTRGGAVDDPLLWGIATGNFLPPLQTAAAGVITSHPAAARVVLGGLSQATREIGHASGINRTGVEAMDAAPPLACLENRGAGHLLVTTLEPWDPKNQTHRQLLATLLADAGVDLPPAPRRPALVIAKRTPPLRLDGRLDDWTSDMEDRMVSRFRHADPIALTSDDLVTPPDAGDLAHSAIVYSLIDDNRLCLAGIVLPAAARQTLTFHLGDHAIAVRLPSGKIEFDGELLPDQAATARAPANTIADTRVLSLDAVDTRVGNVYQRPDVPGCTFEFALPLARLGLAAAPGETWPLRLTLEQEDGPRLVLPAPDSPPLQLRPEPVATSGIRD